VPETEGDRRSVPTSAGPAPYSEEISLEKAPKSTGRAEQAAQVVAIAALLAAPALMSLWGKILADPDIWWHLRTGEWILQHHAVPHVDSFSWTNAGKPWPAYSWLYELVMIKLFQWFGLAGILGYTAAMLLCITAVIRRLIGRVQPDFSVAALFTLIACISFARVFTPRPWLFSILFFALELDILLRVRATGRARKLVWLPFLFALWSNIHIQFIDGLIVLGIAAAEVVATRFGLGERTMLRPRALGLAIAGSFLGTLVNPFGLGIYRVAYDLVAQSGVMNKIDELQAMHFRSFPDFMILFLALGAAAALAYSRRLLVFETGMLAFATLISFRSIRDVWAIGIFGCFIVAAAIRTKPRHPSAPLPRFGAAAAFVLASLMIVAGARIMGITTARSESTITAAMPVKAVENIRAHAYPGPLYNTFDWGGYLIWALRMPVSLDGRAAFYGDTAIDRSVATWGGQPDWASDPQLRAAGIVIGAPNLPLVQLLRTDSHFQLAYEDKVAAVFVVRR
jgi:hypothetical protein